MERFVAGKMAIHVSSIATIKLGVTYHFKYTGAFVFWDSRRHVSRAAGVAHAGGVSLACAPSGTSDEAADLTTSEPASTFQRIRDAAGPGIDPVPFAGVFERLYHLAHHPLFHAAHPVERDAAREYCPILRHQAIDDLFGRGGTMPTVELSGIITSLGRTAGEEPERLGL